MIYSENEVTRYLERNHPSLRLEVLPHRSGYSIVNPRKEILLLGRALSPVGEAMESFASAGMPKPLGPIEKAPALLWQLRKANQEGLPYKLIASDEWVASHKHAAMTVKANGAKEDRGAKIQEWIEVSEQRQRISLEDLRVAVLEIMGDKFDALTPSGGKSPGPRFVVDQDRIVFYRGKTNMDLLNSMLEGETSGEPRKPLGQLPPEQRTGKERRKSPRREEDTVADQKTAPKTEPETPAPTPMSSLEQETILEQKKRLELRVQESIGHLRELFPGSTIRIIDANDNENYLDVTEGKVVVRVSWEV
jgi:hypothetical protein